MKIGLLVTARMGSTRLHDKHLKPLLGRPARSYLLERIEHTFKAPVLEGLAQVFIATGRASGNTALGIFPMTMCICFMAMTTTFPCAICSWLKPIH